MLENHTEYRRKFFELYIKCLKLADNISHHLDVGENASVYVDSEALLYVIAEKEVPDYIIYVSFKIDTISIAIGRDDRIEIKTSNNIRVDSDYYLAHILEIMCNFIKENGGDPKCGIG